MTYKYKTFPHKFFAVPGLNCVLKSISLFISLLKMSACISECLLKGKSAVFAHKTVQLYMQHSSCNCHIKYLSIDIVSIHIKCLSDTCS